ncbi:MAG TPA: DUF3320 domain-containing protein [Rhizomicrobium sp.]
MTNTDTSPEIDNQADRLTISKLFDDARRRLVETGTRNRLVHVNRSNTRGNVINIVNERSDDVYVLLSGSTKMRFLALGKDKDDGRGEVVLADADSSTFDEGRFTDAQLETRLGPDALQKKLLKIAREALTAEEESGVNMLYLALGFLTWFEEKSSSLPREAPLVLLPVELKRNARTSTYDIVARDEDILTNLPLQQRLMEDYGIELPEVEVDEEWNPSHYFSEVADRIAAHPNWKIEPDAIQLGFFSFNKLLMYRDLAVEAWPDDALANHDLTKGLLYEGFDAEPPLFGPDDRLDEVLPPEKLFHVVDADASQAKVIEEVRSGRNLVVQGPPGTGKSQTITNIIAAAAKEGKRVLFLAEKMAALSVVHDRLVKVGLRDICLELHSRGSNKKTVLGELARTLTSAATVPNVPGAPVAVKESRDRLNAIAEALHRPIGDSGETPYSVLGRQAFYLGRGYPAPSLNVEGLQSITREEEAKLLSSIKTYGDLLAESDERNSHPFEGVRNLNLQPVDLTRLPAVLTVAQLSLLALASAISDLDNILGLPVVLTINAAQQLVDFLRRLEGLPDGGDRIALALLNSEALTRLSDFLSAGAAWHDELNKACSDYVDHAFSANVTHLRGPLVAGTTSFFARWGGPYRAASRELGGLLQGPLPKKASDRVSAIDRLSRIRTLKSRWEGDAAFCSTFLGGAWRQDKTDFATLKAVATWCSRLAESSVRTPWDKAIALADKRDLLSTLTAALEEREPAARVAIKAAEAMLDTDPALFSVPDLAGADIKVMASRYALLAENTSKYGSWTKLSRLREALKAAGLASLEQRMRRGELSGDSASVELRYARAEALWTVALASSPSLRDIAQRDRHSLVQEFASLERTRLKDNVAGVLASHLAQVPQGAMGEMGVIRGEIGKKRGHMALRRLFERASAAIQRIKPVLLMSPVSVAQFLPPGKVAFDLLVIDEASQVRPEDALGAIARAGQIVVVGDKKQLPPSAFFDRLLSDEEEDVDDEAEDGTSDLLRGAAKVGTMESILTLCEARGLGGRMLAWHYRSRDPSLIQVSNLEFYESGLVLPPSPLQKDPAYGLKFTRVAGIYDRGGKRDNRLEGEAIVTRIAEHARTTPTHSLGVVTFSFAQRNLITELLESRRRTDSTLNSFLREGQTEDVFVKNIENVQGDERDVILVSVGYGPSTPSGRLSSMSFGPVNGEGGERRLNVLFTRARIRCEIFASFDPADIDLARTRGEGPRIFKHFLDFAKTGRIQEDAPTGGYADSPFEEDVADAIRRCGFLADHQVGSAGFEIDLGIRHPDRPGTYLLAVECDGAAYHSALWARERDRLRQDVLEHLGWRFHRIWSTDWFYNRPAEVERLHRALAEALESAEQGLSIEGANEARPTFEEPVEESTIEIPGGFSRQMPPYRKASLTVRGNPEPHLIPLPNLAELAQAIVSVEGPINLDEVARRVASCCGKEKAGSRIVNATHEALKFAQSRGADLISDDSEFWFTKPQGDNPPVRDRSAESGATTKAVNISLLEIRAALSIARADNAGGNDADLVRIVAKLLGFKRVGPDLQERITRGLDGV